MEYEQVVVFCVVSCSAGWLGTIMWKLGKAEPQWKEPGSLNNCVEESWPPTCTFLPTLLLLHIQEVNYCVKFDSICYLNFTYYNNNTYSRRQFLTIPVHLHYHLFSPKILWYLLGIGICYSHLKKIKNKSRKERHHAFNLCMSCSQRLYRLLEESDFVWYVFCVLYGTQFRHSVKTRRNETLGTNV